MMTQADREMLEALRAQVPCEKRFSCVGAALTELCRGNYHEDLGVLECLDCAPAPCRFAKLDASMLVCTCPMRMCIAKNFARWSAESTALLRQDAPAR